MDRICNWVAVFFWFFFVFFFLFSCGLGWAFRLYSKCVHHVHACTGMNGIPLGMWGESGSVPADKSTFCKLRVMVANYLVAFFFSKRIIKTLN